TCGIEMELVEDRVEAELLGQPESLVLHPGLAVGYDPAAHLVHGTGPRQGGSSKLAWRPGGVLTAPAGIIGPAERGGDPWRHRTVCVTSFPESARKLKESAMRRGKIHRDEPRNLRDPHTHAPMTHHGLARPPALSDPPDA